jgi:hypothetical protein
MSGPSPIAGYVAALERALGWLGIVDRRVVEEAEGHLIDAAAREQGRGLEADAAERAAVAQFGSPVSLAARFAVGRYALAAGVVFLVAPLVSVAILAVGFRLLYDSVLPELAGLVVTGLVLAYIRPGLAWLSLIGIALGILLSERGFPVAPSAEHIARSGPPHKGSVVDLLKICGFPAAGALLGVVSRLLLDSPFERRRAR